MQRKKLLSILFALVLILGSCKVDVDLQNIDPHANLEMSLALPVGDMTATMGDFLGDRQVSNVFVDEHFIFHYIDTVDIPTKNYHPISLANYVIKDTTTLVFVLAEQPNFPYGTNLPTIAPVTDAVETFTFPIILNIDGMNGDKSIERLDSMYITSAEFVARIRFKDLDIQPEEVVGVDLMLSDQFRCPSGPIHPLPIDGYRFDGSSINLSVGEFFLNLLKDRNDVSQSVDTVRMDLRFRLKRTHETLITETSRVECNMQIRLLDYEALWGYFEPNKELSDANHLNMDSLWSEWKNVKKLKARFAEPTINVFMTHKVAAPFYIDILYIKSYDEAGDTRMASWRDNTGAESTWTELKFAEYMSPDLSTLGDSIVFQQLFDQSPDRGHVDKLFDVKPDYFEYAYKLYVDEYKFPNKPGYPYDQLRITRDSMVTGYAIFDVPFKFEKEAETEYIAHLNDVNISSYSFDSLAATTDFIDTIKVAHVLVFMNAQNKIPFDIQASFHFFDADSIEVPIQVVQDNDSNMVHFPAPKMRPATAGNKYGTVEEASDTTLIMYMDQDEYDKFTKVKYINIDAALQGNPEPCICDSLTQLKIHLGVAADVEAIMNWRKEK